MANLLFPPFSQRPFLGLTKREKVPEVSLSAVAVASSHVDHMKFSFTYLEQRGNVLNTNTVIFLKLLFYRKN